MGSGAKQTDNVDDGCKPVYEGSDTVRLPLTDAEQAQYQQMRLHFDSVKKQVEIKKGELKKTVEPRNEWVKNCIKDCGKINAEAMKQHMALRKQQNDLMASD